ncbi:MAG TPA: hypothetical protein VF698_01195 [Thermoanaerobaculia bacterium]|jgi:hypothetical protein
MRRAVFIVCIAVVLAVPLQGAGWSSFYRVCIDDLVEVPPQWVPVGCEAVDCCPGCPGPPDFLEWRIRVEDGLTRGVQLTFDGGDPRAMSNLKLRGNIKRDGNVLIAGPGESFISGLPNARKGNVAVATVKILGDKQAAANLDADKDVDKDNGAGAGIQIDQLSGQFIVNRFRTQFRLVPCGRRPPATLTDNIRLNGNTSSDNAVILADFRRAAGCLDDLVERATTQRSVGSVLANGACNSDVSVFSDDNAMSFEQNVTTWTAGIGDVHTVNLGGMVTVPVTVWLATPGVLARAQGDIANANLLYNTNNVGVRFNATFNDVSGNNNAVNAIGTGDCSNTATLATSGFFTAGRLNVYYVNGAFTGANCIPNRNMSFIGTTANIASLPHEIGHAFSLAPSGAGGHTNGLAGFGNNNIMFGGGPATRDNFSVGQAFRINVANTSQLNINGTRTGPTRACVPLTTSAICPALALDVTPH